MTVIRKKPAFDPTVEELKSHLVEELRADGPDREPYIIIQEKGPGRPINLYVIWEKVGRTVLRGTCQHHPFPPYEEVEGVERVLEVGMALGLRPDEGLPGLALNPRNT